LLQAQRWRVARVLSWIWFWLLLLVTAAGVVVVAMGAQNAEGWAEPSPAQLRQLAVAAGVGLALLVTGAVIAATPLWTVLARICGARIDRSNPAHVQGVVGLLIGSALAFVPLALLGGHSPLSELLRDAEPSTLPLAQQLLAQIYPLAWTALFVLWASAWPARLTFNAALSRLGLERLRRQDLLPLLVLTLGLAAVGHTLAYASHAGLQALGWPTTDDSILTRLMPAIQLPLGALVVAMTAGATEELLVRGLLQPRFGWLLPNIAFCSAHALEYGADGLLVVFVIGACLAFVRQRWNTTAAITVHAGYDAVLLAVGILTGG
jgi:uncharacterized protein